MDCNHARRLIPYEADGELRGDLHNRLQAHLDECEDCSAVLASHIFAVDALEYALYTITDEIAAPDGFSAAVVSRAVDDNARSHAMYGVYYDLTARAANIFSHSKLFAAAAVLAVLFIVTFAIGNTAYHALESTPVASTKVNPGHFIAFTVRPTSDGRVVAGVDTRGYCQVTRPVEETLR